MRASACSVRRAAGGSSRRPDRRRAALQSTWGQDSMRKFLARLLFGGSCFLCRGAARERAVRAVRRRPAAPRRARAARAARSPRPRGAGLRPLPCASRRTTTPPSPRSPTNFPPTRWCTRSSSAASSRSRRFSARCSRAMHRPAPASTASSRCRFRAARLREPRLQPGGGDRAPAVARGQARARRSCVRARDTPAQMDLPLEERRRNVRGAFRCTRALAGAQRRGGRRRDDHRRHAGRDGAHAEARRRRARGQLGRGAHAARPTLMFNIVLVQPEIPPNAGNVIRLAANTGARLHLVEPLGFSMDDRQLKRAGLDYHDLAQRRGAPRLGRLPRARSASGACSRFTTRGARSYAEVEFRVGDAFVFGAETAGLPRGAARGIRAAERGCGCRCSPATAASTCRTPSPSWCSKPGASSASSAPPASSNLMLRSCHGLRRRRQRLSARAAAKVRGEIASC